MKRLSLLLLLIIPLVSGCAPAIRPAAPSAMVPGMLKRDFPDGTRIHVAQVTLGSAAANQKAPFQELAGKSPFVQEQGLVNFQESARQALIAAGAQAPSDLDAAYILRPVVLGAMTIPYPQTYSILFVHYQLERRGTGKVIWSQNVYSQAKLQRTRAGATSDDSADPAYALLGAANLRQMVTALSGYLRAAPADQGREH